MTPAVFSVSLSLEFIRSLHGARLRAQGTCAVNLPLCSGLHLCKWSPEGSFEAGLAGGRVGNLPSVVQCFSKTLNKAEGNVGAVCLEQNSTYPVGRHQRSLEALNAKVMVLSCQPLFTSATLIYVTPLREVYSLPKDTQGHC